MAKAESNNIEQNAKNLNRNLNMVTQDLVGWLGDLFGFDEDAITEDSFSAIYVSGASSYWDCRGVMEAARPVGVVATDLPPRTLEQLQVYANNGGKIFVDSGAFQCFRKQEVLDFDEVLAVYDRLISHLDHEGTRNLAIVMPDVIGDQQATIELLTAYRERILGYVARGADVIVTLQRGEMPVEAAAREILTMLVTPKIRFGIPSNAAALSDAEIAKIRHDRFHILGRATLNTALKRRVVSLLESNPEADISCDGCLIRSRLDLISAAHHEMLVTEEDEAFNLIFDDTELLWAVLNEPNWLRKSEVGLIASLYGNSNPVAVQRWFKAHKENSLAALIEEDDPECHFLYQCLPSLFNDAARRELSARLRSVAVTQALAA